MKTMIGVLVSLIILWPAVMLAETYTAATKDNEVERVGLVQIKETKDVPKERLITLDQIDMSIATMQKSIADLEVLRAKVKSAADKVKLKTE